MNIKEFKETLYSELLSQLKPFGYKLIKSKELYQRKIGNNINNIYIYPKDYSSYLSIGVKCYYDNSETLKILKKVYSNSNTLTDKEIIGGDFRVIVETVLKRQWILPYTDIIHEKCNPINELSEAIFHLYQEYIESFFTLCNSDLLFIHNVLNGYDINKTGLGLSYQNRVIKGLIVAKQAGFSKKEVIELAKKYEHRMTEDNLLYLNDFIEVKNNLIKTQIE